MPGVDSRLLDTELGESKAETSNQQIPPSHSGRGTWFSIISRPAAFWSVTKSSVREGEREGEGGGEHFLSHKLSGKSREESDATLTGDVGVNRTETAPDASRILQTSPGSAAKNEDDKDGRIQLTLAFFMPGELAGRRESQAVII
ncbi:hypothetical protein EYF80_027327 [Liparis tanakae]|uniref:Uncharacterized protein n=1 Tax=Liparis tanakae TaxID=230148 RepID=A0A4Z2H9B9_9TELE|nr:hypothetical protein EYF80_027327 [Liparis tanakae]